MARLIWTEPALRDLDRIAEIIALDKPDAARRLVAKVMRSVERLERFPRSGRKPPETASLPYREVVVPPCRVFYRIARREVFILSVIRGEQLLREEMLEERARDSDVEDGPPE